MLNSFFLLSQSPFSYLFDANESAGGEYFIIVLIGGILWAVLNQGKRSITFEERYWELKEAAKKIQAYRDDFPEEYDDDYCDDELDYPVDTQPRASRVVAASPAVQKPVPRIVRAIPRNNNIVYSNNFDDILRRIEGSRDRLVNISLYSDDIDDLLKFFPKRGFHIVSYEIKHDDAGNQNQMTIWGEYEHIQVQVLFTFVININIIQR